MTQYNPPAPGYPAAPPGYGAAPGAAPEAAPPGYGAAPGAAPPGYGAAPGAAPPGYGAAPEAAPPGAAPPGYGAAPGAAPPGYGAAPGAAPPGAAPPGYGAAPAAPPGYGAAPAAPGYGAAPAAPGYGAAPAAPGYVNHADPADAIAEAELGIARLPPIPAGSHVLQVTRVLRPERSAALVAELTVVESDTVQPGFACSWYQNLDGAPGSDKAKAQNGAALGFVLIATGFDSKEAAAAAGYAGQPLKDYVRSATNEPSVLVGKYLRAYTVMKPGKKPPHSPFPVPTFSVAG